MCALWTRRPDPLSPTSAPCLPYRPYRTQATQSLILRHLWVSSNMRVRDDSESCSSLRERFFLSLDYEVLKFMRKLFSCQLWVNATQFLWCHDLNERRWLYRPASKAMKQVNWTIKFRWFTGSIIDVCSAMSIWSHMGKLGSTMGMGPTANEGSRVWGWVEPIWEVMF